jgi:phosphopantothenoylcysteine decarboxylase/phosphopantothenate--cysteine ligase
MNILITAGATREPLDAVRYLSNVSTGSTGAALADAFAARDHRVTLLRGESAVPPRSACEVEVFTSTEDLRVRLQRRLEGGTFDAVIMCAAVADYRPGRAAAGKIGSDAAELTVRLVRNPKILPQLKSFSSRPLVVVGFKLTVGADATARREAVSAQFAAGTVDAVVHNDLDEIRASSVHPFWLYRSATAAPEPIGGTAALADALDRLLATSVKERTKANPRSR